MLSQGITSRLGKVNFSFKYVNRRSKPIGVFFKSATLDEEFILFVDEKLYYRDIEKIELYNNQIAVVLKPFVAIGKQLTEHMIDNTCAFIFQVSAGKASDIKLSIGRRISYDEVNRKKRKLGFTKRTKVKFFERECPRCKAAIDVNDVPTTHYVYCKHCTAIFDRHGEVLPATEDYKICSQCGYYGRVKNHLEFHAYALPKTGMVHYSKKHYCCDTCAENTIRKTRYKNLTLLYGAFVNFREYLKIKAGRNPEYKGLEAANRFAQDGDVAQAEVDYLDILTRYEYHPGIHFNYGLAYLQAGRKREAVAQFEKCLSGCSNYQPVRDFLHEYDRLIIEE